MYISFCKYSYDVLIYMYNLWAKYLHVYENTCFLWIHVKWYCFVIFAIISPFYWDFLDSPIMAPLKEDSLCLAVRYSRDNLLSGYTVILNANGMFYLYSKSCLVDKQTPIYFSFVKIWYSAKTFEQNLLFTLHTKFQ